MTEPDYAELKRRLAELERNTGKHPSARVNRAWQNAVGYGLLLLGVAFLFWSIHIFLESYRAHVSFFTTVWCSLPLVAYVAGRHYGPFALRGPRIALVGVSVLLSYAGATNYDLIRDSIGEKYASGYIVVHGEDFDEDGPFTTTAFYTENRYAGFALSAFGIAFMFSCFGLPALTHLALKHGSM